ncbi:MAG: hypothetical protein PHY04_03905 [Candidatus ainarchaeum sp.]|nr:hypothetical protein [Candidatus ainarchaeum sp.]MDD4128852.1 hypothetical protein [Candidatus ainarchaeum sp.]
MGLLYSLIEFSYNPNYKTAFFLSPFVLAFIPWIIIFPLHFFGFKVADVALFIFAPFIIYFVSWVLFMMFIRSKYYAVNGELKKIEYVPVKDISDKLAEEAKKLGFDVKHGSNTPWTNAEIKISGVLNETPFSVERVYDGPTSPSSRLNSYSTYIYINSQKKENFAIQQRDLDSGLDSIKSPIKKKIILSLKPELVWLLKENVFVVKIDFTNGSMGAICCNDSNLATKLKETLDILTKVVKVYNES